MNKKLIVSKFGGTSLTDADAIRQSAKVSLGQNTSLIVVSATAGSTDELSNFADQLVKKPTPDLIETVEQVKTRHLKIATDLRLEPANLQKLSDLFVELKDFALNVVEDDYSEVLKTLYPKTRHVYRQRIKDLPNALDLNSKAPSIKRQSKQIFDYILSFGERASSILLANELERLNKNVLVVDARKAIKTDDNHKYATPLLDGIKEAVVEQIMPELMSGKTLVTQGFIGQAPDGSTTTLGRGGSDYSAALFAEALGADELQIWSDVAGIATADPKIVKDTRKISHLTFQEAAELATSGAKILYPKTITPARRANIPVYVGNTFHPEDPGTKIEKTSDKKPLVRAVSIKTKQSLVTLTTERMAQEFGYLVKIFSIFARHKINIDQVSTSEISIAFTLDGYLSSHAKMLSELEELGEVSIENGMSAVSLIGNNVNNTPGLASKIFSCLDTQNSKIAIRMICQGASKHNFCFLVEGKYGEESVRKLHKQFIEEGSS